MTIQVLDNTDFTLIDKGVIKVYSETCGPCKSVAPIFQSFSEKQEYKDIQFGEILGSVDRDFFRQLGVRTVPALLFVKDGKVVSTVIDSSNFLKLDSLIAEHLQ